MATYPGGIPSYNDHKFTDAVTEVTAANSNYWWQELVAICTELGINPRGSATDLVTRLAISLELSGKLKLLQICTSGTRPSSPPEGMLIYETDTKKFYKCTTGGAGAVWAEIATLSEVLLLAGGTMTGAIDMGGFGITNLLDPTLAQDAATKAWVESLVAGINWQEPVLDRDLSTPPSPIAGRYIVKPSGTDAWAGHDNDIADGSSGAWVFTAEGDGMACYVDDENIFVYFDGSNWVKLASGIGTVTQEKVDPDATEATTWDSPISHLKSNLNRIRNQIITITGEAWGTVSHSIATVWAKFHETTGHKHTGAAGDAPALDAAYTHGGTPGTDTHHAKQHAITSTADHTSGATAGKMLKADANGLPIDGSNTDTEVASAVSLKHSNALDHNKSNSFFLLPYLLWRHVLGSSFTGYIDVQMQISTDPLFATSLYDLDSGTSVSGWKSFGGASGQYESWTAAGMPATDVMGIVYTETLTLVSATKYYVRWRVYAHGTANYGEWLPGGAI